VALIIQAVLPVLIAVSITFVPALGGRHLHKAGALPVCWAKLSGTIARGKGKRQSSPAKYPRQHGHAGNVAPG
jgi:hypothetical protein